MKIARIAKSLEASHPCRIEFAFRPGETPGWAPLPAPLFRGRRTSRECSILETVSVALGSPFSRKANPSGHPQNPEPDLSGTCVSSRRNASGGTLPVPPFSEGCKNGISLGTSLKLRAEIKRNSHFVEAKRPSCPRAGSVAPGVGKRVRQGSPNGDFA
jgi:hypothetical protein